MPQRIISFLLLIVLLLNITGPYPLFKLEQYRIRENMEQKIKSAIPHSLLHLISVSTQNKQEIRWLRSGKEFVYKGVMYDIVESHEEAGYTHYYCINDKEEAQLLVQLAKQLKKQIDADNGLSKKLTKKLLSSTLYPPYHYLLQPCSSVVLKVNTCYLFSDAADYVSKITKPPKLIV